MLHTLKRRMRKRRILICFLCVGVIAGGLAYRQARGGGNEAETQGSVAKAFKVLGSAPQPLPRRLQRQVKASLGYKRSRGLEFQRVHRVDAGDGVVIWLLRAPRKVCIVEGKRGALSCSPPGAAVKEGVVLGVARAAYGRKPRSFRVLGLAPDLVRAVVLRVLGGGQRTVVVRDNVYTDQARSPIGLLRFVR